MINRAAIILKYKKPIIDWINATDPNIKGHEITQEYAYRDRTAYLIDED